jgi:predicted phage terminase large subunit-like protein
MAKRRVDELKNKINKDLLRLEIRRQLYRKSFYEFMKDAARVLEPATDWDWNFHHEYLCDVLQKEAERIDRKEKKAWDIIINVPFRSSKTMITSIIFPVWCFAVFGNMSFINLSYSAGLSTDASNKVFELLNNPWFIELFPQEFDDHHRGKTDFKLKSGGSRISSGFLGAVLGRGADIIVMDDPNSPKDLSALGISNTIRTWTDTISTRLNQPEIGLFIVIQQRLHHKDLSGYLLNNFPDKWNHICLPAMASPKISPPYLLLKYQDNLLWKNRFSQKVLDNFKITLGSQMFANQLLQEPVQDEGNIIKKSWIKTITSEQFLKFLYDNNIKNHQWEMFIDSAYTKDIGNDPSGILICAKLNNDLYVRKVINKHYEFPELLKLLETTFKAFNCKIIRVEAKASGLSIIQQLKRQTSLPITQLPTKKDSKEICLKSVSPLIEAGRLILIEDISNDIIIEQLSQFPKASHDEMVDLVYYAMANMNSGFSYCMM